MENSVDHKVFVIVVNGKGGRQTFRHIEGKHIYQHAGEQFAFQARYFVKNAKAGECSIINDVVFFCQVG